MSRLARFKTLALATLSYTVGIAAFLGLVTLIGVIFTGGWPVE